MTLIEIAHRVEKLTIDNSPTICTAIGVAGVLSTAVLTGKATIKAVRILEEKHQTNFDDLPPLSRPDVRHIWKEFIPPATVGVITITAVILANRISSGRAAALAAAYSLSEKAYAEYKDKVFEKLGAKKEQVVRDEIAQDRVNRTPVGKQEVVITGNGDVLCFDSLTGRYFISNMETIRKAMNDTNARILSDNYASLSDFFYRIGLSATTISDEVGWNVDNLMDIHFSTVMSEDSKPCLSLEYHVAPIRDYYRLH